MVQKKMKPLFFLILLMVTSHGQSQVIVSRTVTLMGSRFDFTVVEKDTVAGSKAIDMAVAEVSRIENLISEWIPDTEVSRINENAGITPVKVSREVFDLTSRALYFSKISDGAFDISFAAAAKIWKFDGSMKKLPSRRAVKRSLRKIGYQHIVLDSINLTIFLKLPGMKIGFGSIGKGYAADRAKQLLVAHNVPAGIMNASGDMNTWGTQPAGAPWTIGITNPTDKNKLFATVPLQETAVVTSGSYEKYALINGKRYSHIINPKTGYPVTGLASVTVFGPNAEMANGFSTAIMVLGKDKGLELVNRFPELKCVLVTDSGEIFTSGNTRLEKKRN